MSRFLITIALLLSLNTAGTARVLELLERAVELTLVGVMLPTDSGGTISFKSCGNCTYSTHRTTDATVFEVNGQAIALSDFLRVVQEIHERPGTTAENEALVTVFLDIASARVTRVALRY
jgi:hypothetical protein